MVGLDHQSFRDQFNRHCRVTRENFVKQGGHGSQMIDDDDGNTQIGRQTPTSGEPIGDDRMRYLRSLAPGDSIPAMAERFEPA